MASPSRETIETLIKQARIVSFAAWSNYPAAAIALLQAADDAGRYLSDMELHQLQAWLPSTPVAVLQQLREQADEIVAEARTELLAQFPGITQPGGSLGTAARTAACWRDFWQFLRCITYGIAGQQVCYTSPTGLHYLRLLYRELNVPLDAMLVGLEGVKAASLRRVGSSPTPLAPYFDHLIEQLSQFQAAQQVERSD
jgi:hypothetical protein